MDIQNTCFNLHQKKELIYFIGCNKILILQMYNKHHIFLVFSFPCWDFILLYFFLMSFFFLPWCSFVSSNYEFEYPFKSTCSIQHWANKNCFNLCPRFTLFGEIFVSMPEFFKKLLIKLHNTLFAKKLVDK